jgi:hypothetical protein
VLSFLSPFKGLEEQAKKLLQVNIHVAFPQDLAEMSNWMQLVGYLQKFVCNAGQKPPLFLFDDKKRTRRASYHSWGVPETS